MSAGGNRWFGRDRNVQLSTITVGLIVTTLIVIIGLGIVFQTQLRNLVESGTTVRAEFTEAYNNRLVPAKTPVKIGGVEAGKVNSVERTDHNTTLVTMTVDSDDMSILGTTPTAKIEPKTVLSGGFYVGLVPGGGGTFNPDTVIPVDHTQLPVDLDKVLATLPGDTRAGVQRIVANADQSLTAGARDGLRGVLGHAPGTLEPAGVVLDAAQGTRPQEDLPTLVGGLESTASVIAARQPAIEAIVSDLNRTTGTLAARSGALRQTVDTLPSTLSETRSGLHALSGTLDRLEATAPAFRPAARQVAPLLDALDPVLDDARPLLSDLRPLLHDARPLVQQLVPSVQHTTSVLDDVRGTTINNINGPILKTVLNTYGGSGSVQGGPGSFPAPMAGQADHKFYEEVGYLATNVGRASKVQDRNGSTLGFQAGTGGDSNPGTCTLTQLLALAQAGRPLANPNCLQAPASLFTAQAPAALASATKGLPGVPAVTPGLPAKLPAIGGGR